MSTPGDNTPRKKPTSKKKANVSSKLASKKPLDIDSDTKQQIEDVIAQAFTRFYNASNAHQNKLKDLYSLDTVVSEYLQTFMILGYDINGERICITHAENASARDALLEHLRSTFINIINGNTDAS
jgi:hypothetical protein